ncbi:uncharacterized protein [Macaca nemestrina]|uniref:uncharacterized protein n=1 Tax=Macaca nemestrina TaxID=9545 RepID=UPI0039B87839
MRGLLCQEMKCQLHYSTSMMLIAGRPELLETLGGMAILFPQGGADSHCLCLVCPAGQHSMAGSNLQCPMGFHCQDGVMTPWPGPTSTCRGLPELTDSEDCQQCPPEQEPGPQCSSCIFCSLHYFGGRSPSCQPCPSGYFQSCGAAFVPRHAGSCKDKREAPHQDASFCSAGQC